MPWLHVANMRVVGIVDMRGMRRTQATQAITATIRLRDITGIVDIMGIALATSRRDTCSMLLSWR